jgi:hypothetical protein
MSLCSFREQEGENNEREEDGIPNKVEVDPHVQVRHGGASKLLSQAWTFHIGQNRCLIVWNEVLTAHGI